MLSNGFSCMFLCCSFAVASLMSQALKCSYLGEHTPHRKIHPPPCLFDNHPEIARFSRGLLFNRPYLPIRNVFRLGPLFFVVTHGEEEISGPLKKPRIWDINTTPSHNTNHSTFRHILYRDLLYHLSRKSDGPPSFDCQEVPRTPRQNAHTRPHRQSTC
jgi:hypothetical protein